MTTRSARIDPPAVMTSAFRRPNVIFRTGDRSKIVAPRSAAAAARPRQARYGSSTPPALSRMAAAASRPSSSFTTRRAEQRRVEAGVAPRFVIALQPDGLIGRGGDDRGALRREPALDVEAAKQRRKIERRPPPRLKRLPGGRAGRAPSRHRRRRRRDRRRPIRWPTRCCRGRPDRLRRSTTFTPLAAKAYAVAQPVSPPPTMTTGVCCAPRWLG